MKRFICMLVVLCLLAALPLTVFAAESGECGDGITWTLDGTTLTISGSGRMSDFTDGNAPWAEHKDTITTVKFTGGVTYVGAFAFKNYDKITSVSLDSKTEELGTSAFQGCDGLTKLAIPFTGKFIMGEDSLRNCSNLKRIDFSGRFPKFKSNCLWDTYATLYYPSDAPWPADTIRELEQAFSGRIEFRGSDGSDPVKPTDPKPTDPKPTEKPKPKPTTGNTPTPTTETGTAPTWSIPDMTTEFTVPTFTMPEFTQPQDSEDDNGGSFNGWIAIVIVIGVLAAFAAVTIQVQQVQRRKRRKQRRQRPNFQ